MRVVFSLSTWPRVLCFPPSPQHMEKSSRPSGLCHFKVTSKVCVRQSVQAAVCHRGDALWAVALGSKVQQWVHHHREKMLLRAVAISPHSHWVSQAAKPQSGYLIIQSENKIMIRRAIKIYYYYYSLLRLMFFSSAVAFHEIHKDELQHSVDERRLCQDPWILLAHYVLCTIKV